MNIIHRLLQYTFVGTMTAVMSMRMPITLGCRIKHQVRWINWIKLGKNATIRNRSATKRKKGSAKNS